MKRKEKNMGGIVFSKEEREEYKRIILEKLLDKWNYSEIARYIGIDNRTVREYTEVLVDERRNNF